ncbi:MAG TPA: 2-succinyl-5-enolpyruvyl-6-hydroxy-3-cyclohexene-1-carboxylic-acid synthase [Actinomycetota bacterium]|jgi:2-succinyl-5-enolpyruvyl-6-hydroxy-3-cyclohexene-1-carboxylate synthase|nr:2-succinyl-5-enolpyruvyl-6-hydroxy-3-cyclohexene-1-carboxylic-acid synthase [Actinomycetota bacterium]
MSVADASFASATALVDALAGGGVRHACVSPGSRSTPLALAFARDERITVHVHVDERSAAFFALGLATASAQPIAMACTSGTAAVEYHPAIVEASQARVPLLALTADRPPRVRGTGANQTIDQVELYGSAVRAYLEPPVPTDRADAWFDTGVRAVEAATGGLRGPVHVNCPFEEPLVPTTTAAWTRRATPIAPAEETDPDAIGEALDAFVSTYAAGRGVITIGALRPPSTLSLLSLGEILGWPVLAEPLSGLRLDASRAGRAVASGQLLIGDADWLSRHRPELVLQVGAAPTTRATQRLVAEADAAVVLDRDHLDPDPDGVAERRIAVDPEAFAALAWDRRDDRPIERPTGWLNVWRRADLRVHAVVDRLFDGWHEPFEGRVARDVAAFVPHGGVLWVGSSMPIRDVDAFSPPRRPPRIWNPSDLVRVLGNRGASGIDGSIATILGVASAEAGPTYALIGDVTFLVDAGSLLWAGSAGPDVVIVVIANGGGQIFSLLDQAGLPELEELFVTPHPSEIATVCAAARVGHRRVDRSNELVPALEQAARMGGVQVVEVSADPDLQRRRRAEVRDVVAATLARDD